ncbi:P-loop containing nucleoside triphosphate hydrolase protein [Ramicandelaber brevisporus]|nr:P-loop containing nucleoside triphosphate hydrolase protein [Ramicandelaber brevisporus]
MPLPKSKKNGANLGRSLLRSRFGGTAPKEGDTSLHSIDARDDFAKYNNLDSVTAEGDLDAFLRNAQLAETDFTADRLGNIRVIETPKGSNNPFLLSADKEREVLERHLANQSRVRVPRRPAWTRDMTAEEVRHNESEAFLDWRRGLVQLEEREGFVMTPYERNIEVWRQLWRVVERSDLVVQVVDARNPLLFRCEDLEAYVAEVDPRKKCMLVINKADMLTQKQREHWADYFESKGIDYRFFSAKMAAEELELEKIEAEKAEQERLESEQQDSNDDSNNDEEDEEDEEEEEEEEDESEADDVEEAEDTEETTAEDAEQAKTVTDDANESTEEGVSEAPAAAEESPRTRILSAVELMSHFVAAAPEITRDAPETLPPLKQVPGSRHKQQPIQPVKPKITIGLTGYPNVGKSSTINAIIGAKKVSISSTPGKTRHFQTLHISDTHMLCDCPGLVFPSFATTAADMVCNGVLPIDQMREYTGPVALLARHVPKWVLEAIYGIEIRVKPVEEGGTGVPTSEEVLVAFAVARGYTKSSAGNPDEARAARHILKDFINGRILYCVPPPSVEDDVEFNDEIYDPKAIAHRYHHATIDDITGALRIHAPASQRNDAVRMLNSTLGSSSVSTKSAIASGTGAPSAKVAALDRNFFAGGPGAKPALTARQARQHQRRAAGEEEASKNAMMGFTTGKFGSSGFKRVQAFPHQGRIDDSGEILLEAGEDDAQIRMQRMTGNAQVGLAQMQISSKKHHKKPKRVKKRSGDGVEDIYG